MTDALQTHSSCVTPSYPCCSFRPWNTNIGPHQASAPATNDTHVKPAVDNMKLLLKSKTDTLRHKNDGSVTPIFVKRNCFVNNNKGLLLSAHTCTCTCTHMGMYVCNIFSVHIHMFTNIWARQSQAYLI
jgi:hypothetical protein